MKKKLLVLLIVVIPALMPNLASAVAIDVGDVDARHAAIEPGYCTQTMPYAETCDEFGVRVSE